MAINGFDWKLIYSFRRLTLPDIKFKGELKNFAAIFRFFFVKDETPPPPWNTSKYSIEIVID